MLPDAPSAITNTENTMMVRRMLFTVGVAAVLVANAPALAGGCKGCAKVAKASDGFCCGKGKAFGVDLTSKQLHAALVGYAVEADKIRCPGCKVAMKTSGSCDYCKVIAADGKFYRSHVAAVLAKGSPVTEELIAACPQRCEGCKVAFKNGGKCEKCGVGFVAGRMFTGKDLYTAAQHAFKTLTKAASLAKDCEACAVAMVTNGTCEKCKVRFENGKKASEES